MVAESLLEFGAGAPGLAPSNFAKLLTLALCFASSLSLVWGESVLMYSVSVNPSVSSSPSEMSGSIGAKVIGAGASWSDFLFCPGSEGGWDIVMTEEMDSGLRPVSDQLPLRAASKNGEAKNKTSLWALKGAFINASAMQTWHDQPESCVSDDDLDTAWKFTPTSESLF